MRLAGEIAERRLGGGLDGEIPFLEGQNQAGKDALIPEAAEGLKGGDADVSIFVGVGAHQQHVDDLIILARIDLAAASHVAQEQGGLPPHDGWCDVDVGRRIAGLQQLDERGNGPGAGGFSQSAQCGDADRGVDVGAGDRVERQDSPVGCRFGFVGQGFDGAAAFVWLIRFEGDVEPLPGGPARLLPTALRVIAAGKEREGDEPEKGDGELFTRASGPRRRPIRRARPR